MTKVLRRALVWNSESDSVSSGGPTPERDLEDRVRQTSTYVQQPTCAGAEPGTAPGHDVPVKQCHL
jgi:hypothetical protein